LCRLRGSGPARRPARGGPSRRQISKRCPHRVPLRDQGPPESVDGGPPRTRTPARLGLSLTDHRLTLMFPLFWQAFVSGLVWFPFALALGLTYRHLRAIDVSI